MFILCVKSSHAMGMGHLFRAINLYAALQRRNAEAIVVLLGGNDASVAWLEKQKVPFIVVGAHDRDDDPSPWEADLIARYRAKVWINDRMQTGYAHAARIKDMGVQLVTFDDKGPGAKFCDLHVAPLAAARGETPEGKRILVGLEYLVLPPELARYRRQRLESKRWMVSLGGSDTYGATLKVVRWLNEQRQPATIVLGPSFAHKDELAKMDLSQLKIKQSVPSLIEEFHAHDLAITGGGVTAFEAAAAGLPTVIVANEPWEVLHGRYLEALGCSIFAGFYDVMDLGVLQRPVDVGAMSLAALTAVKADGAERVGQELLALIR